MLTRKSMEGLPRVCFLKSSGSTIADRCRRTAGPSLWDDRPTGATAEFGELEPAGGLEELRSSRAASSLGIAEVADRGRPTVAEGFGVLEAVTRVAGLPVEALDLRSVLRLRVAFRASGPFPSTTLADSSITLLSLVVTRMSTCNSPEVGV